MKIGQKLVLGFIVIASLVAIAGAVAIKLNTEILLDVDQILLSNSKEAKAAAGITYQIQRIQSGISELLLETIDERPERKKRVESSIANSVSKLQQFNLLWEDAIKLGIELSREKDEKEKELKAFKGLKTKIDGFVLLVGKTVVLREEKGAEAARLFFESEVEPLLLESQKAAKDLEKSTRQGVITETEQIRQAIKNSTWISIVSSILGLLAVITVRCFINRTFSNPITKLIAATAEMGKGKLQTKIEIKSRDEIGALADFFNEMSLKLEESRAGRDNKVQPPAVELSVADRKLAEEIALRPLAQRSLERRIKQLNCFYGLSKLIETPQISLEQIFKEAVNLIRNAYQYPDITCVRITFDGIHYKTDNFEKTELSQYAQIKVRADKAGDIEVYYLGEKAGSGEGPFLEEECDLLDAVAERLGSVAERKQAEDKLQLFRNLIDRSNDSIFTIEPKWGRLLDVNDRACDSLGYTREELLDMAVKDIDESIPDDTSWQEHIEELKLKGDIIIQGRHKRKDATTFYAEMSLKLVRQKKEDYIIAVARDITERKQAEERQAKLIQELKSTNQKVESINQELKDFAYIVSHDLKAPLRGIKTLADWISTDYADRLDKEGTEQMNLLLARVGRMHNLIDGVLQYSRVGRVKEDKVQVDLKELIPDVIDMVAPPGNIEIAVENQLPVVECEKTCIMQVFQNLLSNAVKYMDKPKGQVKIGCVEENGFWKFSVSDNGPGIEEKHFERIFRIFQTLSPRDEFESTGIGLTVIKKIVELQGGKIWVESKVGQGCTFFFTLPVSRKEVKDAKVEANIAC